MKIFKFISLTLLGFITSATLLAFIFNILLPIAPETITKISNQDIDLTSEFHEINTQFWEKESGKVIFNNKTNTKQELSLFTSQLPSEHKKDGYITSSVTIPGYFDSLPDDCIIGFQIGEKNAAAEEQLILGVNGLGGLVFLDGNRNVLSKEKLTPKPRRLQSCNEELTLSFHYYKNPKGWIIYFSARDEDYKFCKTGAQLNNIPTQKLDNYNKEISLVIYNPSQKGNLWFKEWNIQNDWTPND